MKIFLLWLSFVCCGIANGVIYDYVCESDRLNYMMVVGAIALILLFIHRIFTRNWKRAESDTDPHHPMVFGISTGISFFVVVITLLSVKTNDASWGAAIGVCTAFVCFLLSYLKEMKYTSAF